MLGHVVVKHFANCGHDVTFTTRGKVPTWMPLRQPVSVFKFDAATDPVPDLNDYDVIINCIGKLKQDKDANPSDFYEVNSVFPWKLARDAMFLGKKLFHISSDCIYSGTQAGGCYVEMPGDAKDFYGHSKWLGEIKGGIVVRTSIIGPADKDLGLFEWFKKSKKNVKGYTNHIWSGVTTLFLAEFLEAFIASNQDVPAAGMIIQLASEPISKCDLLKTINTVFEFGKTVEPVHVADSINRTLIPNGYKVAPSIEEQLTRLKQWMALNGE